MSEGDDDDHSQTPAWASLPHPNKPNPIRFLQRPPDSLPMQLMISVAMDSSPSPISDLATRLEICTRWLLSRFNDHS